MSSNFLSLLSVVKRNELKNFTLMALLIFCILFNYSFIHSLKESLIIPNLGAEAANFIDLWIVLPAVFIFTLSYLKLSTLITNKEKLFYLICSFFLIFYYFCFLIIS